MSRIETEPRSIASENRLEVISYDDKDPLGLAFIVKSPTGHTLKDFRHICRNAFHEGDISRKS